MVEISFPEGVVAVVRTTDEALGRTVCLGLAQVDGIAIEVTLTTPGASSVIRELSSMGARVGAGTVLGVAEVDECVQAGATFMASPVTDARVIDRARRHGVPFAPGVMTPTEALTARSLGAPAVKVFPINAVGGTAFITTLLEPIPDLATVVSGGVKLSDIAEYLDVGSHAVCVGRSLIDAPAAAAGDIDSVGATARRRLREAAVQRRADGGGPC
ncbi:MAG: hypothetical protein QM714_08265 [Nocardioides sp.]|uniref:bifunctional 4-hydroxy-2-oxoglutarate aldolase/2-dehydro-3-deoxy-phosphogluconate aldolase n=1 Tax=Nocardioides sp. TaxID=35761 RepID=UPI0039E5C2D3